MAPITTLTNADCAAVGASKFINHSAQRQLIKVITSIMKRGNNFHRVMRSNVTSAMRYRRLRLKDGRVTRERERVREVLAVFIRAAAARRAAFMRFIRAFRRASFLPRLLRSDRREVVVLICRLILRTESLDSASVFGATPFRLAISCLNAYFAVRSIVFA